METLGGQVLYALAWLSFGGLHSLLAHPSVRRRLESLCGAAARLVYNSVATVHIAVVLALGHWVVTTEPFPPPGWARAALWAMAAAGAAVLLLGLREYDLGRFAGTWQLRNRESLESAERAEPLVTRGLHRYVRHPLYSGGMLLLWGLAQSPFGLATACWGTLYFLIGTWFEERKLVAQHGAAYRDYRRRVPAFVPWKGRAI